VERPWYSRFNWLLAATTVALALFGDVVIHSATLHNPDAASELRLQRNFDPIDPIDPTAAP